MATIAPSHIAVPAPVQALLRLYEAALAAADPAHVVPPYLPSPPKGRTVVVGLGKAGAAMAAAVEAHWKGTLEGVVVVPHGSALPLKHLRVMQSSHPVPDDSSVAAAQALMASVSGLGPDDLVIALISGGGSALCALPADGLTLADKQSITRQLLRGGASIHEFNTVRRHLSAVKGGRLAAHAYPARVVSLLISDIPGDEPSLIASGPTLPDASTCEQALAILRKYEVALPPVVEQALQQQRWESVKPSDARIAANHFELIASARSGLDAAARAAAQMGLRCHVLSDAMEGEARDLAASHAAIAIYTAQQHQPFVPPCVILSGGEATVTVKGQGKGGRNTEFLLALAQRLGHEPGICALSAGTDGLDGNGDGAGAWWSDELNQPSAALAQSMQSYLDNNDSYRFFEALGAVIRTGPTHTNINDFRAMWVG